MNREITELGTYPYRAVTHLYVTFPDGSVALGTGAVIGRNDVLTATHVLYNPDAGGWASDIRIAVGVDYNSSTYRYESVPLVDLDGVRWLINGFPSQTYQDGDNQTLTFSESQSDVALIGLSQAIGDRVGYFGLASGYDNAQLAYQIGYPQGSSGMMYGALLVQPNSDFQIYQASADGANQLMGPGSSGGPLFVLDDNDPFVIGVRSSGSETKAYWADIGHTYPLILQAMAANDELLAGWTPDGLITGSAENDVLYATNASDTVQGGNGLDFVVFTSPRSQYGIVLNAGSAMVNNNAITADIDTLTGVERLSFSDGTLAVDVGIGEVAGSAYRLYQAAFDRQPDQAGLGYWINQMDGGMTLQGAAQSFVQSGEFQMLYGALPSNESLISSYYLNVLDRTPDAAGHVYWLNEMDAGLSASGMLVSFSESQENQIKTSGALEQGIWLG